MNNISAELNGVRILTTDPEKRIGLYAIRNLGRAGATVDSIAQYDPKRIPMGFASKYLRKAIQLKEINYYQSLKNYFIEHSADYDFIVPIDISKMLCLLNAHEEKNLNCSFLIPKKESLIIADNKELLTKHAKSIGLHCPKTWYRIRPDQINEIAHSEISYPCIIKFRGDSRQTHWNPEERYSIVDSPKSLMKEYLRLHQIEEYPIVQEFISGQGFGYFALFDNRRTLKAQFCHRRIREYPITGGPSSCCESVYDETLVSIGRRLLESLEWTGLAMVEFKYDCVRKQFFVLEINPRYWGSLPLAVYSGVNFPLLHTLSALDRDYLPVLDYKIGNRLRFLDKDTRSIFQSFASESNLFKKIRLLTALFDPKIKEGFIEIDDFKPLLYALRQRI